MCIFLYSYYQKGVCGSYGLVFKVFLYDGGIIYNGGPYLSPGLRSLAELVRSLLICIVGDDKNLSLAARILAVLSESLAAVVWSSILEIVDSTFENCLSKNPGCCSMNFAIVGTIVSDICRKTGTGAEC